MTVDFSRSATYSSLISFACSNIASIFAKSLSSVLEVNVSWRTFRIPSRPWKNFMFGTDLFDFIMLMSSGVILFKSLIIWSNSAFFRRFSISMIFERLSGCTAA